MSTIAKRSNIYRMTLVGLLVAASAWSSCPTAMPPPP